MKIITILGARPQFIKASMLSKEIQNEENIDEIILHTGQHFDDNMSNIFFSQMSIPLPKYNLEIHSLTHGAMTARQLENIEEILLKEEPDIVIVYGDTNSTLAGALAATKLCIPLAHVEAGLRSYNMHMPEEINRVICDRISNYLFCPSKRAVENLKFEGVTKNVYDVGDIMYDAVLFYAEMANQKSRVLKKNNLISNNYILATIHRQENTDDISIIEEIFKAFLNAPYKVVIPMHPRTKNIIKKNNIKEYDNILVIDPLSYFDMLKLQKNAAFIVTDSGGLQKEAYYNKVPCITIRNETEWTELIEIGANIIVGTDYEKIMAGFEYNFNFSDNGVYGNGKTASKILECIKNI